MVSSTGCGCYLSDDDEWDVGGLEAPEDIFRSASPCKKVDKPRVHGHEDGAVSRRLVEVQDEGRDGCSLQGQEQTISPSTKTQLRSVTHTLLYLNPVQLKYIMRRPC